MRFYINNIVSDYYSNSDIAPRFTYRTIDIENIELAGGNYTLNLKLPKTYRNCQTFGFINRIEKETTFWYNKTYTARVELDGNTIFEGTLTVDSITDKDFECTLIGNNIDWSTQLDKSLREIESFDRPLWSGVRSTLYNPFPLQYTNSVGYRDYWLDSLGTNSLKEANGLEFALPLISYGQFPAPRTFSDANVTGTPASYIPVPINAADAAGDNRWCLYNTEEDPLNWGSIFPCPYLKTTIKKIFEDININVAGDLIIQDKYDDIVIPFTSSDQPEWNWGLLARTDIEFTQRVSTLPNPNRVSFLPTSATNPNDQVQNINNGILMDTYIKINFDDYDNYTHTPSTLNVNELYMYNDSFFTKVKSQFSNRYFAFSSQAAGTYRITWDIKGFSAFPILPLTDAWFHSSNTNTPGFYFLLVKKPNQSIRGINDSGLVDFNNHLVLDPQVVGSLFFDTTTGTYDNIVLNPIDFTITADVEMDSLETVELYFCSVHTTIASGFGNEIRFEVGETSRIIVEPLDLSLTLNPARFLPDISQRDFLRTVLNMYNLFLYYDKQTNTVWLNEYENYFLPTSVSLDWSDKASLEDESVIIKPGFTFRSTELKLTPDSNDIYETLDNIPTDYTITNNFNYWNETKTVELLHSFTSMRNYYVTSELIGNNNILPNNERGLQPGQSPIVLFQIDIPTLSDESTYEAPMYDIYEGRIVRSYDFNLRLLKYIGIKPIAITKSLWIEDIAFNMIAGDFYYPYAIQEDTASEFNPRFVGTNSLLPPWEKWIQLVNSALQVSLNAYLTASDIAQLDIRKPIRIGSETFIISSIEEYNPVELTTTKIKLYKK